MRSFWDRVKPLALSTAFLILIIAMFPRHLERYFVYFPVKELSSSPASLGLPYQDLFLLTEDSVRIHGWFVPQADARTTFLIFHGNAGNIAHRLPWIESLRGLEAHILIVDYRGYGRSEGKPFEEGLYKDAMAAYKWWSGNRSASGEKLVVIGESLGGAVAVDLASRVPVAGLILQSTFTSAWDMAKTLLPLGLLQPLVGVSFDSAGKIGRVACPILIIHGDRDEIVPLRLGKRLFDQAGSPKEFYEVQGAGHNDLLWLAGPEYNARLRNFLSLIEEL